MINTKSWTPIDADACLRYTLNCQTREGGFCFYAYRPWGVDEPNGPDTLAAIEILRFLRQPVPRAEACVSWLRTLQNADGYYPSLVIGYAAIRALDLLCERPDKDARPYLRQIAQSLHFGRVPSRRHVRWLREASKCIELLRHLSTRIDDPMRQEIAGMLDALRGADGGYGMAGENLIDTAAALALSMGAGISISESILSYAENCWNVPMGFNITPAALSSNLSCQRAGVVIFSHFGRKLPDTELVRTFVANCQTKSGGFARTPKAIARLDDTALALGILDLIRD